MKNKIVVIGLIVVIVALLLWWGLKTPTTKAPEEGTPGYGAAQVAPQNDTTKSISADVESVDTGNVNAEFQTIDSDMGSL